MKNTDATNAVIWVVFTFSLIPIFVSLSTSLSVEWLAWAFGLAWSNEHGKHNSRTRWLTSDRKRIFFISLFSLACYNSTTKRNPLYEIFQLQELTQFQLQIERKNRLPKHRMQWITSFVSVTTMQPFSFIRFVFFFFFFFDLIISCFPRNGIRFPRYVCSTFIKSCCKHVQATEYFSHMHICRSISVSGIHNFRFSRIFIFSMFSTCFQLAISYSFFHLHCQKRICSENGDTKKKWAPNNIFRQILLRPHVHV